MAHVHAEVMIMVNEKQENHLIPIFDDFLIKLRSKTVVGELVTRDMTLWVKSGKLVLVEGRLEPALGGYCDSGPWKEVTVGIHGNSQR